MKRMKLTVEPGGYVTLSYDDPFDGLRRERVFSAPAGGGYVREHWRDGRTTQPCDRLESLGGTLRATLDTLPAVIRREYRAMRQAERRAMRLRA